MPIEVIGQEEGSTSNNFIVNTPNTPALETITYVVTVQNVEGTDKFFIDGFETPILTLSKGNTYIFDQSDPSNSGHEIYLSETEDGHHSVGGSVAASTFGNGTSYTGTPGTDGELTFVVSYTAPPNLYYVCETHSGQGGMLETTLEISNFNTSDAGGPKEAGPYQITFASGDNTFDIYLISASGDTVGYSNTGSITASEPFEKVCILGAAPDETVTFSFSGSVNTADGLGDEPGAAAYITGVTPTDLPQIDDTATVTGGNFGEDTAVSFVSGSTVLPAKNITIIDENEIIVTRPDNLIEDDSPYTIRVETTGVDNPSSVNFNLTDRITAGSDPTWVTISPLNLVPPGINFSQTLEATDAEGTVVDYSVVSGSLTPGLSLNSSTGEISGTTTANEGETFTFTIRATDDGQNTTDKQFTQEIGLIKGGTVTTDDTYTYRTFTSSGAFEVALPTDIEYLIVGGGSSGGQGQRRFDGHGVGGGGGGAGGLVSGSTTLQPGYYAVSTGSSGGSSSLDTFTTAIRGGGGGSANGGAGGSGGSGGGGSGGGRSQPGSGGLGTSGQGFNGGSGGAQAQDFRGGGGGGGGAGGNGGNAGANSRGSGGAGVNSFSAWSTATGIGNGEFARGGAGGAGAGGGNASGGGAAFTGAGGSGASHNNDTATGAGQAGVVIVRYLTP